MARDDYTPLRAIFLRRLPTKKFFDFGNQINIMNDAGVVHLFMTAALGNFLAQIR